MPSKILVFKLNQSSSYLKNACMLDDSFCLWNKWKDIGNEINSKSFVKVSRERETRFWRETSFQISLKNANGPTWGNVLKIIDIFIIIIDDTRRMCTSIRWRIFRYPNFKKLNYRTMIEHIMRKISSNEMIHSNKTSSISRFCCRLNETKELLFFFGLG